MRRRASKHAPVSKSETMIARKSPLCPTRPKYARGSYNGTGRGSASTKTIEDAATRATRVSSRRTASRCAKIGTSTNAMTPNDGNSASAILCKILANTGSRPGTSPMNASKPATRPAMLHGSASRTATSAAASPNLRSALEFSDHSLHAAEDRDIARVDWRHRTILRLQPNAAVFLIKAFDRRFALDHRDHDLPVVGRFLRPYDDQIAVEDRGIDHRVALHAQHEAVRSACERRGQHEFALDVLLRGDGNAGRDLADHGHDDGLGLRGNRTDFASQGPRLGRIAADEAVFLERLEVGVDRRGGRQPHALADLADRRRVAPLGGELANHLEYAALPLRGLLHAPFPPAR